MERNRKAENQLLFIVNKSRSPDLLFANRISLKNFDNFPPIIQVFF